MAEPDIYITSSVRPKFLICHRRSLANRTGSRLPVATDLATVLATARTAVISESRRREANPLDLCSGVWYCRSLM